MAIVSLLAGSALVANAASEEVTMKLGGKRFQNGKTLRISTTKKGIQPSALYDYEISGTVQGKKGMLGSIFPTEVPLDTFLNGLKKGSSSVLVGTVENPDGSLPVTLLSKSIKGKKNFKGVGRISLKLKLDIDIAANGQINLTASKVRIKVGKKKATGFMRFGKTSTLVASTAPIVEFRRVGQNVDEGAGTIDVVVWRQGNTGKPASVDLSTIDGTAIQPGDYAATNVAVSFAAGETEKTVSIPIVDDAEKESFERFTIQLSNPGSGTILGDNTEMTVGIFDND